jgi:hypothetical protein
MLTIRRTSFLFISTLVLFSVAVAYIQRTEIVQALVRNYLLPETEKNASLEFNIGDIRGSLFSSLYFKDITIEFLHPESGQAKIIIPHVAFHYDLLLLRKGYQEFLRGLSVQLEKGRVNAKLIQGDQKQEKNDSSFSLSPVPDSFPAIRLDDWSFTVSTADSVVLGKGVFLSLNESKDTISVKTLNVKQRLNSFTLTDSLFPLSGFSKQGWPRLFRQGSGILDLELYDAAALTSLPFADDWTFLFTTFPRWSITGELRNGKIHVPKARCSSEKDYVAFTNVTAEFPLHEDDWKKISVNGAWQAEIQDIGPLAKAVNLPLGAGFLSSSGKISGNAGQPLASFRLSGKKLLFEKQEIETLEISGNADGRTLTIDSLSAAADNDRLTARLSFDFSRKWWNDVQLDALIADINVYLPEKMSNELYGNLSLTLSGKGPMRFPDSVLRLKSSSLTLDGRQLSDLLLDARISQKNIKIDHLQGRIADQVFITASASLTPSANWKEFNLLVKKFSLTGKGESLALTTPTHFQYNNGLVTLSEPLFLDTGHGLITASGSLGPEKSSFQLKSDNLNGNIIIEKLFGQKFFFDTANFILKAEGPLATPNFSLSGAMTGLGDNETPLEINGDFNIIYDKNGLFFKRFDWSGKKNETISFTGHLPLRFEAEKIVFFDREMSMAGRVELPDADLLGDLFPNFIDKGGSLAADISVRGKWEKPAGSLHITGKGFSPSADFDWLPPGLNSIDAIVRFEENRLHLDKLFLSNPIFHIKAAGEISEPQILAWLQHRDDTNISSRLEINTSLEIYNISWLAEKFGFHRLNGLLRGELNITGPLQHPQLSGKVHWSEGSFLISPELPALKEIVVATSIHGNTLVLESLTGLMGGAPVTGSGSIVLKKDDYLLDITLTGTDMLFYRQEGIKLRGNGDLHLHGTSRTPVVDGKISLTDSRYSKNVDFLSFLSTDTAEKGQKDKMIFSFHEAPLKDTRFNIHIGAEKPFVLANNVIKAKLRPDLRLAGTGELPYLTGTIYLDDTILRLPAGRLSMAPGLIRFPKTDPNNPELVLSGNTRIMGYDITVRVEGSLVEPVITLSSTPSLSNEDLLLLVMTGKVPSSENGSDDSANMSMVALYLGQDLLTRLFGSNMENGESLLDRLQVDIGRSITRQGEDTIETQFRLMDGVFSPRDSLYITAEKDIWDDYNGGIRLLFKFH